MGLAIFGSNATTDATWVDSPQGRGTWDILSSCIITLGLCVYSAIHLNIPDPHWGFWSKTGMKAKWLLIALLAPEFVVYNAWRQRREAQEIVRRLREHCGQPHPQPISKRMTRWLSREKTYENGQDEIKDPWTLLHGFYIVMGGYALDMSNDQERLWPYTINRLTITHDGFFAIFDDFRDLKIPYLTTEAISDKSKANYLVKGVVCVQALWFCAQFFGRLSQLPVTLLELNTCAHSICALLIYMLWWSKPLDIDEPTLIETQNSEAARGFACVGFSQKSSKRPLFARHWYGVTRNGEESKTPRYQDEYSIIFGRSVSDAWRGLVCAVPKSATQHRAQPTMSAFKGIDDLRKGYKFVSSDPPIIELQRGDQIPGTDRLLSDWFKTFELDEILLARLQRLSNMRPELRWYLEDGSSLLEDREPNFTLESMLTSRFDAGSLNELQIAAITISGIFYGGLHTLSWDSTALKSDAESILWKISCIAILSTGPLVVSILLLMNFIRRKDRQNGHEGSWTFIVLILVVLVVPAMVLLYLSARVFLIVEVFLSLPHADPGVYQTPDWSPYWPHVS